MNPGKNKSSRSREAGKKGRPLGFVILLAAAGGMVLGSAGTYYLTRPAGAPTPSALPAAGGMPSAQTVATPTAPAQQQFTSAPQPPGAPPPGKVWSPEHGHWHDAPGAVPSPPAFTLPSVPGSPAAPVDPTVIPAPTPAPVVVPAEKKE